MNLEFRLNSRKFVLAGLAVIILSIAGAFLFSPWLCLFALAGPPLIWRLQRTQADQLQKALAELDIPLLFTTNAFRARVGEYFLHGPISEATLSHLHALALALAEQKGRFSLSEETMSANRGRAVILQSNSAEVEAEIESLRSNKVTVHKNDEIVELRYLSNNSKLTIATAHNEVELEQISEADREHVIDMIAPTNLVWDTQTEVKRMFQFNLMQVMLFAAIVAFGSALTLTATGSIAPKDLPLMTWKEAQAVRGKGAAIAWLCAGLSNLYLMLVDNLAPIPLGILGTAIMIASAVALYRTFWAYPVQTKMSLKVA